MSAPTLPDDSAVGPPERLHPLFLVKGIGGSIRGLAGLYAFLGYLVISGQWSFAILAAIASLLFGIVGGILYWRRFEYRVGQSEIRIDSGILSRRHRSIPFERIQDADITQGPLDRLLGIAQVKLETGGGSAGKNAEEGVLQAITLQRAHELRKLIRARRAGTPSVDRQVQEDRLPVYAMDLRRLLIAGAFNFSLAIFAGLIGITQTFGDTLGFDPLSERFWRKLLGPPARLCRTSRSRTAVPWPLQDRRCWSLIGSRNRSGPDRAPRFRLPARPDRSRPAPPPWTAHTNRRHPAAEARPGGARHDRPVA